VELLFLRHGLAGSRAEWRGPDAERPLTDQGRDVVRRAATLLANAGVEIDAVVTSPFARARETAAIAAAVLDISERLADDERLTPGFDETRLGAILADHAGAGCLLLVGHEPDFSATIGALTGGDVVVKKAGIARVDLDEHTMRGRLLWLLAPRILPER
jgi:phosphohistidine phosphatase